MTLKAHGSSWLFQQHWTHQKNIRELQQKVLVRNNFEIISGEFPHTEIKSFQMGIDEGWNHFEMILFHMWLRHKTQCSVVSVADGDGSKRPEVAARKQDRLLYNGGWWRR